MQSVPEKFIGLLIILISWWLQTFNDVYVKLFTVVFRRKRRLEII